MVCILSSVRFTDRCQFEKDTKKGKNDGGRSFFFSARRESEIDIERERERVSMGCRFIMHTTDLP